MEAARQNGTTPLKHLVTVDDLVLLLCETCGYEADEVRPDAPLANLPDFDSLNALKFQLGILERYSVEVEPDVIPESASLHDIAAILTQQGVWRAQ